MTKFREEKYKAKILNIRDNLDGLMALYKKTDVLIDLYCNQK